MARLSIERRTDVLNQEIGWYAGRGYRVQHATDTTAQMVKPKKFSLFWALAWLLVFGVGILVYCAYYLAKRDETRYIRVNEEGEAFVTDSKGRST